MAETAAAQVIDDKGTAAAAPATGATTTTDKGAASTAAAAATTTVDKGTAQVTDKGAQATNDVKGFWPEKWQERVSKGDEKRAKAIKKFESPEAIVDSYLALERRLSSGEYVPVLPKDPKPEEVAAWRKANGIPDAPDKYDVSDLKAPEEDKAIVENLLKVAHSANLNTAQTKAVLGAFYAEQDRQVQEIAERDESDRQATLDSLSEAWGQQRQRNINLVRGVLTQFPESIRELVGQARLPNGKLMFNDPDVARGFAAIALALNPAGIVAPGGSGDIGKSALSEYQDLQKFMREKRSAYNTDKAKQDRMGQLIEYLQANELIDGQGNPVTSKGKKAA